MNYRVERQIKDSAEHYGRTVLTRGNVIADPPWNNLRSLLSQGFLVLSDAPVTLKAESPVLATELEEIQADVIADLEPDTELIAGQLPNHPTDDLAADVGGIDASSDVGDFECRASECDKGPWPTKRARTSHEVRVHGRPGG